MNNKNCMNWIHISDLHFGDDSEYCKKSRKGLKDYLLKKVKPVDYIFVTGDIIYAGNNSSEEEKEVYYEEAYQYLKEIYEGVFNEKLDPELSQKKLFISFV